MLLSFEIRVNRDPGWSRIVSRRSLFPHPKPQSQPKFRDAKEETCENLERIDVGVGGFFQEQTGA